MPSIGTISITAEQEGLTLSFEKQASLLPNSGTKNYLTAREAHILAQNTPDNDNLRQRAQISTPHTLGTFTDLEDGPDIFHNAFKIKRKLDWNIGLPRSFAFALPLAAEVGKDLLSLYGPERFHKSDIMLIAQRSIVENNDAQRNIENFDKWHTHINIPEIDLIYGFCNHLSTEFKSNAGHIKTAPPFSLNRFGTEEEHRSPTNLGEPLRRTWGAFMVYPNGATPVNPKQRKEPSNVGLSARHFESFNAAALTIMAEQAGNFVPVGKPLFETHDAILT